MSRVDEALRRAAETAGREPALESLPEGPEAYPAEPDRRQLRPVPTLPPAIPAPAPPAPARPARPLIPSEAEQPFLGLSERLARKVVVDREMMPASREQYRRLAATLHETQASRGLKVVMIVSAAAGEGKTLTAANLSLTLSESYQRNVLLIDGDLRRPSLDALFQVDGSSGLHDGLTVPEARTMALHRVSPRLAILPAGQATSDPIAGLTSDRMRQLITEARESFDWVIIDTPPIGLLPDANLLASIADGAVLVVKADATPYDLVQRAVDALGRDRMLGVVLNRAAVNGAGAYYANYYAARPPSTWQL